MHTRLVRCRGAAWFSPLRYYTMHRRTVRFDAASTVWTWKPFLSVLQVFTINFTVYTMYTQIKRHVNWRVFCGPRPTNHWKLTHAVNILINDSRMFMHDFTFIHLVFLRYMHGAQSLRFALQYSNDCFPPPRWHRETWDISPISVWNAVITWDGLYRLLHEDVVQRRRVERRRRWERREKEKSSQWFVFWSQLVIFLHYKLAIIMYTVDPAHNLIDTNRFLSDIM